MTRRISQSRRKSAFDLQDPRRCSAPLLQRLLRIEQLETRSLLTAATVAAPAPLVSVQEVLSGPADVSPAATGASSPVGLIPSQLASYYGLSSITFKSSSGSTIAGNGAGVTIAIVDPDYVSNIQAELTTFDSALGIAPPPSFTVQFPYGQPIAAPTDPSSGWGEETALDVEWAHAIAPAANILLVETPLADIYTGAAYAAQQPGVAVVSMSWGAGEVSSELSDDSDFVTPAGHAGVVFVAASGDNGSPGLYPAASPNVLAIGGTQFIVNAQGTITGETAWNNSGGGVSPYEPQPAYQKGIVTQSSTFRGIPDVSINAGSAMTVYDSYDLGTNGWVKLDGTSFGTPIWGAIIAIADQGAIAAGGTTLNGSQASTSLYNMESKYGSQAFNDITTGNNGFAAGVGYDLATGLGSPQAGAVIAGLSGNLAVPTPASPSGTINTTAPTFQWSAVSGAASYQLIAFNEATGVEMLSANVIGATSYTAPAGTFLPGQTYQWQISAIEDSGVSSSLSSAVTLSLPAIGIPTLIAPASGSFVYTATPTFQWSAVAGANSYNLQVVDTAAPGSPTINTVVSGTTYTPVASLLVGHTYRWSVSTNEILNAIVFSGSPSTTSLLTVMQLGTPTPISPLSSSVTSTTPIFSWTGVSGAANYILTLTDLTAATSLAPVTVTSAFYQPTVPLTLGDNYQWQVQAADSVGDLSSLSGLQSFTATSAPTVTGATTPQNLPTTSGLVITPNQFNNGTVTNFLISGITGGALFLSDGTTAVATGTYITLAQAATGLIFTPAPGQLVNGSFNVQAATTTDGTGLTGSMATAAITVTAPVAFAPTVTGATTLEDAQTTSGLVITPSPLDSGLTTYYQITAISGGTLYLSDGLTPVVDNQFITAAQGSAGLRFTPTNGSTANGNFAIQTSTTDDTTGLGGSIINATVNVTPVILSHISSVSPLPARTSLTSFTISWSGSDPAGIQYYEIYESINNGPFQLMQFPSSQIATTATSFLFTGAVVGDSYGFYSMAFDNSGAVEESHVTADTTVVISQFPWQNPGTSPTSALDVLGIGGAITPTDALAIINALNTGMAGTLPVSQPDGAPYLDVLGNNFLAPNDALAIINYLNTGQLNVTPAGSSPAVASTISTSTVSTDAGPAPIASTNIISVTTPSPASTVVAATDVVTAATDGVVSANVAANPPAMQPISAVSSPVNPTAAVALATTPSSPVESSLETLNSEWAPLAAVSANSANTGSTGSPAPPNQAWLPLGNVAPVISPDQSFAKPAAALQLPASTLRKAAAIDAVLNDTLFRWIDE